jgi:hypothetical protein
MGSGGVVKTGTGALTIVGDQNVSSQFRLNQGEFAYSALINHVPYFAIKRNNLASRISPVDKFSGRRE